MRRLWVGVVVVGLAAALAAPAFASGKQIICWAQEYRGLYPFDGARCSGMRFQTLIDQSQINYKGKITQVEFYNSYVNTGKFYRYKLILAYCGLWSLSTTFAENYKGKPVTVADLSYLTCPRDKGWYPLGMSTTTFDYNNTDHLLIEIQWQGSDGMDCPVDTGADVHGNHMIWAVNDPNAPKGRSTGLTYYTRLSFDVYPAVTPASLGRVKALYE